jgi:hypothetical protein
LTRFAPENAQPQASAMALLKWNRSIGFLDLRRVKSSLFLLFLDNYLEGLFTVISVQDKY